MDFASWLNPDAMRSVAVWREALLARKVLRVGTRGYKQHLQLDRFRSHERPVPRMSAFIVGIAKEAQQRGYLFDTSKIAGRKRRDSMTETRGQTCWCAPQRLTADLRRLWCPGRIHALHCSRCRQALEIAVGKARHARGQNGQNEGLQRGPPAFIVTILFGAVETAGG